MYYDGYYLDITATPVYYGIPVTNLPQLNAITGQEEYDSNYYYEEIIFEFSPDGEFRYFNYNGALDVVEVPNESVAVMSFDEMTERIETQLSLDDIGMYQLFGDDLFTFISVLLLVGCGFGAGMVLGFMATIYVSGERVYAPLYGILLAVTLFGICRQRSVWKEPAAVSSAVFLTALTVVCCAVNVLFIVLSL